jgi:dihydroneopterin aldolase
LSQIQADINARISSEKSLDFSFLPSFVKSQLSPGHSSNDWGFFGNDWGFFGLEPEYFQSEVPPDCWSKYAEAIRIRVHSVKTQIELTDLDLNIEIGAYTDGDVVPDKHILDLNLSIDPALVLIDEGQMDRVFDYAPLIREIQRLAEEMHYETQERFITRIVDECVKYNEIKSVEVFLRKTPVFGSSGELGVRLQIGMPHLRNMRTGE